jgi:hypothetical protein
MDGSLISDDTTQWILAAQFDARLLSVKKRLPLLAAALDTNEFDYFLLMTC